MKYARISERGEIRRIFDEAPPHRETVEISDPLAAEARALIEARDHPVLFEGGITTRRAEREAGNYFRWDEEAGAMVRTPIPIVVPAVVSRRGFRKALRREGITFKQIKAKVNDPATGLDEDTREDALIDIEDAQTIRRDHGLIALIGAMFGKSDGEIDDVFVQAPKLDK